MNETNMDADFCMVATGDCMTGARIFDGDLVYFKKQEKVENGDISAVLVDGKPLLKRFFYYPEKSVIILKMENPKYSDLVFTGDDINRVKVIGKAVYFTSHVK